MKRSIVQHFLFFVFICFSFENAIAQKTSQAQFITQIDYHGPTCQVTANKETQSVSLGEIEKSMLKEPGDMSPSVPFNIYLNCEFDTPAGVQIIFDGVPASDAPELLALNGQGTENAASGIGIALFDKQGKAIPLHEASSAYPAPVGESTLPFSARYKVIELPVSSGPANATATFQILYP
ncbi:fimbrial protein [Buttiauxella agrestis]|uniref:fimbrial protein n=1 Tax=Buttiauxella agrestis TaxID=82977 RepID=UPI0039763DDB